MGSTVVRGFETLPPHCWIHPCFQAPFFGSSVHLSPFPQYLQLGAKGSNRGELHTSKLCAEREHDIAGGVGKEYVSKCTGSKSFRKIMCNYFQTEPTIIAHAVRQTSPLYFLTYFQPNYRRTQIEIQTSKPSFNPNYYQVQVEHVPREPLGEPPTWPPSPPWPLPPMPFIYFATITFRFEFCLGQSIDEQFHRLVPVWETPIL